MRSQSCCLFLCRQDLKDLQSNQFGIEQWKKTSRNKRKIKKKKNPAKIVKMGNYSAEQQHHRGASVVNFIQVIHQQTCWEAPGLSPWTLLLQRLLSSLFLSHFFLLVFVPCAFHSGADSQRANRSLSLSLSCTHLQSSFLAGK